MQTCEAPAEVEAGASVAVQASRPNSPEDNPATAEGKSELTASIGRWLARLRHGPGWGCVLARRLHRGGLSHEQAHAFVVAMLDAGSFPAHERAELLDLFTAGWRRP
jgi:hypothetical protein